MYLYKHRHVQQTCVQTRVSCHALCVDVCMDLCTGTCIERCMYMFQSVHVHVHCSCVQKRGMHMYLHLCRHVCRLGIACVHRNMICACGQACTMLTHSRTFYADMLVGIRVSVCLDLCTGPRDGSMPARCRHLRLDACMDMCIDMCIGRFDTGTHEHTGAAERSPRVTLIKLPRWAGFANDAFKSKMTSTPLAHPIRCTSFIDAGVYGHMCMPEPGGDDRSPNSHTSPEVAALF